jgi:predicted extracellular nuclease
MRRTRISLLLVLGMLAALLPMGAAPAGAATPTELFFSEYIEGSSFNKAIEIYNGTGAGVDLSAGTYTLELYSNGASTASKTLALTSSIVAGDVFVIAHTAADADILAEADLIDSANNVVNWNGDDAVVLRKGAAVVDVIGQVGSDPGSQWGSSPTSTKDHTLQRAAEVCAGDTDGSDAFDPAVEWVGFAQDTFDGLGSHTANCDGGDLAPAVNSTSPADGAADVALDTNIEITFSEDVDVVAPWFDITCTVSGTVAATVSGGPASFTLDPAADFVTDESCTVTVTATQVTDQDVEDPPNNMAADYVFTFATPLTAIPITLIHDVQGDGFVSPLVGNLVTIEGVVVGDFQSNDGFPSAEYDTNLGGYHVQEEDADADGNPLTSEGVFVRDDDNAVSVGDVVRVSGTVAESSGLTRIESVTSATVVGPGAAPTPATVTLPFTDDIDFESVEGMSVQLQQALYISEYFNFDRFGEIVLSSTRAMQPTAVFAPGSVDAINLADENVHSRITLDDGRTNQNPSPAIHPNGDVFGVPDAGGTYLTNLFRGGSTVQDLPGVMDYAFGAYRIQPTTGGTYTDTNPRESTPDAVGGALSVATFNVLNYFTTLDDSGPICGPLADQGCRGADNALEFERQRTKIINAISAVDADVVGLMEIENDAADVAVADLVAGLNEVTAPGTYEYVATGPVGPDAIRVALIYQPASVEPYGAHAELAGAFLDPNGTGSAKNRAALAQSFVDNANGGVFTVAVNHLKSKGSSCGAGDDDPMQGSCNVTRTLAAGMLADWLQADPTNSGDVDFLIIGDLNSYDKEDPIGELAARGYEDLIRRDIGEYAYSYLFSAQLGYLDYIMANGAVAPQVTDTTVWHINADEPDILDYDTRFNPVAMYEPNAFRSSDHDPVIVGLNLTVTPMQAKAHAIGVLSTLLPTGDRGDDNRIGKAIESIEDSLNPAYWIDDFHLTDQGNKVFDEEKKAVMDLIKVLGPTEAEVDVVIAALVKADQDLAATAIDDAIAAGGSEKFIDKALLEMEEAQADLDQGRPEKAIDHYKQAWHFAQKALAEAPVRFATFNASLNRFNAGDLATELSVPGSAQPATIAEIIQRNRPDVVLINEFDYDADGVAAEGFQDNYLAVPQNGASPIVYPYRYVAPSNTGVPSGFDLDNFGGVGGPNDAFGFGFFEGQYAFVVYSMYPIDFGKIRTFQNFLWKDMPGALLPEYDDGTPWFTDEELDVVRLSSKNHVDVPIRVDGDTIHFLVSHPTPPVFDGDEDRNGKRNYDEIRFWADYVNGGKTAEYIYDDAGMTGGLNGQTKFVIAGDLNSDPLDGDSIPGSAQQLLDHPNVNDSMTPSSLGGPEQAALQGGINDDHLGDPAFDTADFADWTPGNLRADYVLPRNNMTIAASGVFWPEESNPLFPLVGTFPFPSSDHRLVWIDIDM